MPVKTSLTHPLEIDPMPCGAGLLGLTLCPGKQGPSNFGDPWERDLGLDMRAILDWGASTVVSLMEAHELPMLNVPGLGDAAEDAGLEWHHLPIPDVKVPDERFERLWTYSGHVLRGKLRSGEKIVLHCRGGLGRTGMIAAGLAIELGVPPDEALRGVREARAGTVETRAQEAYVLRQRPSGLDGRYADRVLGCLLGGAVGDALGYAVEFLSLERIRERFGPEGIRMPALNAAGKAVVSDDTQMTIFTADGLIESIERNGSLTQDEALDAGPRRDPGLARDAEGRADRWRRTTMETATPRRRLRGRSTERGRACASFPMAGSGASTPWNHWSMLRGECSLRGPKAREALIKTDQESQWSGPAAAPGLPKRRCSAQPSPPESTAQASPPSPPHPRTSPLPS